MEIFQVGGSVRDAMLGVPCKDFDYTVVIPELIGQSSEFGVTVMRDQLLLEGFDIFLDTPAMGTIRARFPKNHKNAGQTADFVLARREVYTEGSRFPEVVVGTLHDDLARRDFTINAMATDANGEIIDPFDGQVDLRNRVLRTPLDAMTTLADDPLRALRAVRFRITKEMEWDQDLLRAMYNPFLVSLTKRTVSAERMREELRKAFKHDTFKTMKILSALPDDLVELWLTSGGMWLEPTFKA